MSCSLFRNFFGFKLFFKEYSDKNIKFILNWTSNSLIISVLHALHGAGAIEEVRIPAKYCSVQSESVTGFSIKFIGNWTVLQIMSGDLDFCCM